MRSQVQCATFSLRRAPFGLNSESKTAESGYLSVGFTESEFTAARPTAGEVQLAASSLRSERSTELTPKSQGRRQPSRVVLYLNYPLQDFGELSRVAAGNLNLI